MRREIRHLLGHLSEGRDPATDQAPRRAPGRGSFALRRGPALAPWISDEELSAAMSDVAAGYDVELFAPDPDITSELPLCPEDVLRAARRFAR